MSAQVYFTDLRTNPRLTLMDKLEKLVRRAGIERIDFEKKFVAIKIHFGEAGNIAYIRPNYTARMVKLVREFGGLPFATDANTLYTGQRANAVEHLAIASEHGFNRLSIGCDVIIADGLKGTEYREIPLNMKHCKTAKIGSAVADADIIISMTHFKGHEMTGFGGVLKNLGMGAASRGGKLELHSASQPLIDENQCVGCRTCVVNCSQSAISMNAEHKAVIDYSKCIGCGQCVAVCMYGAAYVKWNESAETAAEKISEYTYAIVKDKPHFHVSFVMNISPDCDCFPANDQPIVADIGMLASFDPVALDRACIDLVNQAPVMPGSRLDELGYEAGMDKFDMLHANTNWRSGLDYAEEIGLGTQDYELIKI
ncbi:MAG: DUF362 domain-containing protein [Anaerolineaceae bacterium]|nr:DUF362 domain-containing protein [Anaerolineaceae bacterium]